VDFGEAKDVWFFFESLALDTQVSGAILPLNGISNQHFRTPNDYAERAIRQVTQKR